MKGLEKVSTRIKACNVECVDVGSNPTKSIIMEAMIRMSELSIEEKNKLIASNPAYGKMICKCEFVTEGEIIDAIKRPLGAKTLDGVKRRTKAGMGLCQGKTCERLVAKIIREETGISMDKILPATKRIPVRPVKIGVIGENGDE